VVGSFRLGRVIRVTLRFFALMQEQCQPSVIDAIQSLAERGLEGNLRKIESKRRRRSGSRSFHRFRKWEESSEGEIADRYTIVTIRSLLEPESFGTKRCLLERGLYLMKISSFSVALSLVAAFAMVHSVSAQTKLNGAGATFPAPLYQRWIAEFGKANPNIQINYQAVGSGTGITNFTQGIVNFGGSDAAMTDEQIGKVKQGVVLIPATAGSIVLAYNLPGVENLKLSREAYVDIFLGKITKWSDPKIAQSNSGVKLPDTAITVCERSDGSGTTFVFTKHLSAISPDFKSQVGEGTTVTWPTGVAGKGNDGVTALIKGTVGAVGYVEYGYAKNNKLSFAQLENKSKAFVAATPESGAATLNSTQFPSNSLRAWPSDPDNKDAYPIATFTWLLLYKKYDNKDMLTALKKFVSYGLSDGQKFADELGYIPLPKDVVAKCEAELKSVE
jgi:phosphate transport system substrate-binding protein